MFLQARMLVARPNVSYQFTPIYVFCSLFSSLWIAEGPCQTFQGTAVFSAPSQGVLRLFLCRSRYASYRVVLGPMYHPGDFANIRT